MDKTLQQYDAIIAECVALFEKKAHDYGTAWRILRVPSLTDQIMIKGAAHPHAAAEAGEQGGRGGAARTGGHRELRGHGLGAIGDGCGGHAGYGRTAGPGGVYAGSWSMPAT